MNLLKLDIENFMGIRKQVIDFNGRDTLIVARNGTGKTTVYDSFLWVLFNRNSEGTADFDIKPLDENNNLIRGADTKVTVTLDVGYKVEFTKTLKAEYKRGADGEPDTYKSDAITYAMDGINLKKGEFDEKIKAICNEEIIRLITNPSYFLTLHWEKQRAMVETLVPAISKETVIATDPKHFEPLAQMLENHTIAETDKMLAAYQKDFVDKLKKIAPRIEEAKRGVPEGIEAGGFEALSKERDVLVAQKEIIQTRAKNAKAAVQAERQVKELALESIKEEIRELNKLEADADEEALKRKAEIRSLRFECEGIESDIEGVTRRIGTVIDSIKQKEAEILELKALYSKVRAGESSVCPMCGAPVVAASPDAELRRINAEGKQAVECLNGMKNTLAELEADKALRIEQLTVKRESLAVVDKIEAPVASIRRTQLNERLAKAEEALLTSSVAESFDKELDEIGAKILALGEKLAKKDAIDEAIARVAELEKEERNLAGELGKVEGLIAVLDKFTLAKAKLLESSVNALFTKIKFKMFETTQSGSTKEAFVPLFDGVPYRSANTGKRINAGIEIINKFCEHYGVTAPLFVDHAESVTEKQPVNSQVIYLVAKKGINELKIEFLEG